MKAVASILEGKNPNRAKQAERRQAITLNQCFSDYMEARGNNLASNTQKNYNLIMEGHFSDWKRRTLKSITRKMIGDRHKKISKDAPVAANNAMRVLRALFNFAKGEYLDNDDKSLFPDNPVQQLNHAKQWARETRRKRIIEAKDLPGWLNAVDEMKGEEGPNLNTPSATMADYLVFILFTGLRRRDAFKLRWNQVDLTANLMRPVIHKKQEEVMTLPLSTPVRKLLELRFKHRINDYVFPGRYGKGHFEEPKKHIAKITKATNIEFSSHDLRRTFITMAENLDISIFTLKRLCTHSPGKDVTGGYVIMDEERLEEPAERVAQALLKRAGRLPCADVISIKNQN